MKTTERIKELVDWSFMVHGDAFDELNDEVHDKAKAMAELLERAECLIKNSNVDFSKVWLNDFEKFQNGETDE